MDEGRMKEREGGKRGREEREEGGERGREERGREGGVSLRTFL